jgi:hypothetical protein
VLETAVEQHAWEEVLAMAEPDHYFTQVLDLGMSHDQYIKELLGLGFVDNDIDPPPDSASEYPAGDRIRDISYGSWKLDRDWLKILGTIQDDRGSSLRLTLLLKRTSRGIVLSGAVG